MTDIKFSVHPSEKSRDVIPVICSVDDQLAVNLHCHTVAYGEPWRFLDPIFNDFCRRVPEIVYEICGKNICRDWIFHAQPELA